MTAVTATSRAAYRSPRHDNTQKQKLINALALHGPRPDIAKAIQDEFRKRFGGGSP